MSRLVDYLRAVRDVQALSVSARAVLFVGFLGAMRRYTFRLRTPGDVRLVFPAGSRREDLRTFYEIWRFGEYGTDFADATVVDIGGHKGYFGAWALANGAHHVTSFEPDPDNFAALAAAASSTELWEAHQTAIGASSGTAYLERAALSSAHRLGEVGIPVSLTAAADIIRPAGRLIVKIDAEGAECEIILGTPPRVWRHARELLVELHEFAPCTREAITEHLALAGLTLRHEHRAVLRWAAR